MPKLDNIPSRKIAMRANRLKEARLIKELIKTINRNRKTSVRSDTTVQRKNQINSFRGRTVVKFKRPTAVQSQKVQK